MQPLAKLDDPAFQSAFVAVSYLLGRRVPDLSTTFSAPAEPALETAQQLTSENRQIRRAALVSELQRVARSLEGRRLA